ncbi:MAG: hypothetical protein A2830_03775 [Candidatus Taylorbacteria bacterium RIFCSPHIGHO2_01_FULL_44_110]|uniref:Uncharacterized protein n=1 Tax=Candidatus Taylorbacteria bacterium RIFCSPHIGHO2_12_FULL_45_16 TaxID=1802315 RepID=A0A1G2N1C8_9BACT|nr:MAG: hypothetical protein A2830_03775 [Candidatus Taylorbacteria bacterium RIFCSPHIGHO2_01_FULL_44_110]OHA29011.1 MAG: hypothetical protein A3F51_01990 [Candidatus Taylorbacteria bacterium RIFCSPHIGHO2_12_FULL_45_16]OHA33130.1 MAG: hypothetical protein A3A23_03675 [Candidatus Taylorbacteria bacterium RIFCSPLOWO2_01_FULL_45_59]OHA39383.1 MAG: hypothetical protein A3I98_02260 [Candidatus Taylorbacteria bacterium RIFCSPLOWO2_02_FULL_45_10b]OHA43187.1 MAG: hypothetical protein A3G04_03055 [Candi
MHIGKPNTMKKNIDTTKKAETKTLRSRKAACDKTTTKTAAKKKVVLPLYCNRKNPFTPEAWAWVNKEDVWPGTDKPLCFMPPNLIFEIANAQRRTLDLDQVKVLVYPEGPTAEMCSLLAAKKPTPEEKIFTPVNYAYAVSPKGLEQIEAGTPLAEVKGFFSGRTILRQQR